MMNAASPHSRYLSLWLRRLSTDRLTRSRSSAPVEIPLVIAAEVKSALRLAAVNDAAARLGLKTGMALADARAMYPKLAAAEADPEADRQLLDAVADWCDRYTPLVGLDPPDGLVLDVTGCAHLFGGEAELCRDIVRRLAAQGLHSRVAVADTVGGAWAAARYGESSLPARGGMENIIPSHQTRDALLPLPLAALRIAPEIADELAQVGLTCIADVISRPRAPLAARFGEGLLRRLDQALGREDESISPRLPLPAAVAERRFPDPIAREEDVLGIIEQLARELKIVLERRGEGARRLQVALFRADGKVHRIEAGTAAPLREPKRMRALFVERLAAVGDECDPGFGFDMVRLAALATERCDPTQTGLAAPDHDAELTHLIDRFGARFGLRRITRFVPQDMHIPEFAVASVPAHEQLHANPSSELRRSSPQRPLGSTSLQQSRPASEEQDSLAPARPLRLFEKPEPIEATAEVPDGPPVQFTWRRVRHVVAHAEGPERIAMQWWRDDEGRKLTRDYFRIESKDGMRVWIYREGFFNDRTPPNWFLHGVFA